MKFRIAAMIAVAAMGLGFSGCENGGSKDKAKDSGSSGTSYAKVSSDATKAADEVLQRTRDYKKNKDKGTLQVMVGNFDTSKAPGFDLATLEQHLASATAHHSADFEVVKALSEGYKWHGSAVLIQNSGTALDGSYRVRIVLENVNDDVDSIHKDFVTK